MRWFWIDKFVTFESGKKAVAQKAISMGEEHLHDHFPGYSMMPTSLTIEGLAQTGGLLVSEHHHFERRVALAKISKATFHDVARPGDVLTYTATLRDIGADAAVVEATSHIGDRLHLEAELMFAFFNPPNFEGQVFELIDLACLLRGYGLFEIGVARDGSPLRMPRELAKAEAELVAQASK